MEFIAKKFICRNIFFIKNDDFCLVYKDMLANSAVLPEP